MLTFIALVALAFGGFTAWLGASDWRSNLKGWSWRMLAEDVLILFGSLACIITALRALF